MDTRAKILEEASKLFAERGYASASVRNIAKAVGIGESAIYNHYKSKFDILLAFIESSKKSIECRNLLTDELINLLTDPKTFLYKFTEALFDRWNLKEEKVLFTIIVKEDSNLNLPDGARFRDYLNNLEGILDLVFTQMIKHKFIASYDPRKLSELFFAPLILARIDNLLYGKDANIPVIKKYLRTHADEIYKLIKLKK